MKSQKKYYEIMKAVNLWTAKGMHNIKSDKNSVRKVETASEDAKVVIKASHCVKRIASVKIKEAALHVNINSSVAGERVDGLVHDTLRVLLPLVVDVQERWLPHDRSPV